MRDTVTQFDKDGNIVSITYGTTAEERLEAHNSGKCDFGCGLCYEEAIEWQIKQTKLNNEN